MNPKEVLYHEDLGVAYGMKGDFNGAIQAGLEGIKIDPKYAPFYFNVGVSYRQLGDQAKATEYFQKAAQLDPAKYGSPQQAPAGK
jgi:tetratricopeptide (TPR) repeat protein